MKRLSTTPNIKRTLGFFTLSATVALVFTACSNDEQLRKDTAEFRTYVSNHRDSAEAYVETQWDKLEAEYNEKKAKLDTSKMATELRETYNETVHDWETFKTEYKTKQEEKAKIAETDAFRTTLTIQGVRPDYSDLSNTNILAEYEHFVNVVKTNKDTYTKEQWLVVNNSWKALQGRKKEIDNNISGSDNGKIMKLQVEYTAIKAVNRPFAENEANS